MVERSDTTGTRGEPEKPNTTATGTHKKSHPGGMPAKGQTVMGSTFTSLHVHLVFSTKHRQPTIKAAWRNRLHEYLGGTVKGLDGFPQAIGGTEDHIHLLVGLKSTHRLADFMRELKKSSSNWIHNEIGFDEFAWQEGYGAFTVSPPACGGVKRYIANQEQHHRKRNFREELIELLQHAGIEYDSKWLD